MPQSYSKRVADDPYAGELLHTELPHKKWESYLLHAHALQGPQLASYVQLIYLPGATLEPVLILIISCTGERPGQM